MARHPDAPLVVVVPVKDGDQDRYNVYGPFVDPDDAGIWALKHLGIVRPLWQVERLRPPEAEKKGVRQ